MKQLISVCLLLAMLAGCMSIKKATDKVLTDPAAKEKVGREWEKSNPCSNDTVVQTKRDTTVSLDTAYLPGATYVLNDTVFVEGKERVITRKVTTHDTIRSFITDNRRLYLAEDSTRQYKVWMATEKAENARLNAEHNQVGTMLKYAAAALLKKWWFWALLLAAGGLWYLKSKTSILSIFNRKS